MSASLILFTCTRNIVFEYRTNKATHFARRTDCYALLAINKTKHMINRRFRAPVVTQFIVKVNRKIEKKSHF